MIVSNNNNKPPRKIEFQQDFHTWLDKEKFDFGILIKKNNIAEEIAYDAEKNRENVHDVALEYDKCRPKDHLT